MSAASKAFLADPKAFMKQNVVVIDNVQGVPFTSGEQNFDLESAGQGLNSRGDSISAYRLCKASAGAADIIAAYWLAYVEGAMESQVLKSGRKIFFTAGLSGCGFAAGSGPNPIVKHIDGKAFRDDEIIDSAANSGLDIYTQANYKSDDRGYGVSTVFGIKNATGWEFWAQPRFLTKGAKQQLRLAEGIVPV